MSELKPIPEFNSENEEFEFWSAMDSGEYLDPLGWKRVPPPHIAKTEDIVFLSLPHFLTEQVEQLSRERKLDVQEILRQLLTSGLQQQRLQPGA